MNYVRVCGPGRKWETMNKVLMDIAEVLGVEIIVAAEVRDYIDEWYGIDYSECTKREFEREVRAAYEELMNNPIGVN